MLFSRKVFVFVFSLLRYGPGSSAPHCLMAGRVAGIGCGGHQTHHTGAGSGVSGQVAGLLVVSTDPSTPSLSSPADKHNSTYQTTASLYPPHHLRPSQLAQISLKRFLLCDMNYLLTLHGGVHYWGPSSTPWSTPRILPPILYSTPPISSLTSLLSLANLIMKPGRLLRLWVGIKAREM